MSILYLESDLQFATFNISLDNKLGLFFCQRALVYINKSDENYKSTSLRNVIKIIDLF